MARPFLSVAVPRVVVPSLKTTEPVGMVAAGAFESTAAVNGSIWPDKIVNDGTLAVVVVVAFVTTCTREDDALDLSETSPVYLTESEWVLAIGREVTRVTAPASFKAPVPRMVAPSWKLTVPVGVPTDGLSFETVAVRVTCCPGAMGPVESVISTVLVVESDTLFVDMRIRGSNGSGSGKSVDRMRFCRRICQDDRDVLQSFADFMNHLALVSYCLASTITSTPFRSVGHALFAESAFNRGVSRRGMGCAWVTM